MERKRNTLLFGKQLEDNNYVDNTLTDNWLQQHLSSHIEDFVMAIQEQELDFKIKPSEARERHDEKEKYGCDVQSL